MAAPFKKTNTKVFIKSGPELTPDNIYWKKYSPPVLIKEFGLIDYIDFSPVEPHYFAVTCSVRVQIYNPITKLVTKNLTRFREAAYGGSFRNDGKLLCAGGEESKIRLFDVSSKCLLRLFSGHKAPVHRTFFTADSRNIVSFSDDKTVALWDIPTEKQIISFNEHNDYIRAGAVSPVSPDIFVSGSYDNTVQMYDSRTNKCVFSVNHESPVESLVFLPSGGVFISAGGTEMKVWDALAGGRLLTKLSNHHKLITCLKVASNGKRILSGSLDRHVKIYDAGNYKTVHTLDYPNGILSIGTSPDDETIVAGMIDGLISVRRREHDNKTDIKIKKKKSTFRRAGHNTHSTISDTIIVPSKQKEIASKHDVCLRKFQYSKALDSVMKPFVANKTPHVSVALLQELTRRKGLTQSLAGRDDKSLVPVIKFIIKHIGTPRYGKVLIHVANVLMDVYEDKMDELGPESRTMFTLLDQKLNEEEDLILSLTELEGKLHLLLSAAESAKSMPIKEPQAFGPSDAAQKNLILSIG